MLLLLISTITALLPINTETVPLLTIMGTLLLSTTTPHLHPLDLLTSTVTLRQDAMLPFHHLLASTLHQAQKSSTAEDPPEVHHLMIRIDQRENHDLTTGNAQTVTSQTLTLEQLASNVQRINQQMLLSHHLLLTGSVWIALLVTMLNVTSASNV